MDTLAALPKYDAYKDSSEDWIADIPEHWDVKKLKYISKIINGDSLAPALKDKFSSEVDDYWPYIASKDINVNTSLIDYENGIKIPRSYSNYKLAPNNSSLICIEGGSAGKKIAYTNQDICYVNKLACIRSKYVSNRFIYYSLYAEAFQTQFKLSLSGLIGGVAISAINNFFIVNPPIEEQNKIANFLDKKTTQIDEVIAIKEKQIDLLKERKQIFIQKAVTQGLNPNVPMKDSDVDWIGQIPEHWEIHRSKFLFAQRKERAWKSDVQLSATQAYGVIPQEEYEKKTGKRVVKIQFHLEKRRHVEKNDFVISMRSFQGGLERAWARGCIRSSYVVLRALQNIDPNFYGYLLKLPLYIKALQQTASFIRDGQDLNYNNFSQVELYVPPIEEQREISNYVESFLKSSDQGVRLLQEQIEKLKEYKTTLINSAVTGKIKIEGYGNDA